MKKTQFTLFQNAGRKRELLSVNADLQEDGTNNRCKRPRVDLNNSL